MDDKLRQETLITFFFGANSDYRLLGIFRAYRDFNRTLYLNGQKSEDRYVAKTETAKLIIQELSILFIKRFSDQKEFDDFHKQVCNDIKLKWEELSFGQIQKWVNMTLKYWLIMGNNLIPNIELNSEWFHIPIDNMVLNEVFGEKYPKIPWSRMDYEAYFLFQERFRKLYPDEVPLIKETQIFNKLLIKKK